MWLYLLALFTINSAFKFFFLPACFKSADVTTLHKKGKKDLKEN